MWTQTPESHIDLPPASRQKGSAQRQRKHYPEAKGGEGASRSRLGPLGI